jgi:hypothetical protein
MIEMEPQKRRKFSNLHETEEIAEVLIDEDSNEELEWIDERMQSFHPQTMKTLPRKRKLCFELKEQGIHQMPLISLDLLMASIV